MRSVTEHEASRMRPRVLRVLGPLRTATKIQLHHPAGTPCVQGMFTGCGGGTGGVPQGPVLVEKSKNSLMSGMAASRAVRFGNLKRVSISLSAAVKSIGV